MTVRTLSGFALLASFAVSSPAAVSAQQRWIVDPATSLAWWQMNPNYGHLWATTCPGDPNWSAGEGHTGGFSEKASSKKTARAAHMTAEIPLYPRLDVTPVCRKAVVGQITVEDPSTLKGAKGFVMVSADSLEIGSSMRDSFQHKLLQTDAFPKIEFALDSVISVQPGEVTHGTAVGQLTLHGVKKPIMILFDARPEAGGVRVQGKWLMFPRNLVEDFGMSKVALGAGVGMNLWKELHMGFDLIFKPVPGTGAAN